MKTPTILVPFKGRRYKSRLWPVLSAKERRGFAFLLLRHVLETLRGAGLRGRTYVISSDPQAATMARRLGVSTLRESKDTGVNGAVRLGVRRSSGSKSFMVVPSDLALATPSDLKHALRMHRIAPLVIAPSASFNGTNLLIFPRNFVPSLSYDDNSFWNHLAGAARQGLTTAVLTKKGLVFDVDTPDDAAELVRLREDAATARYLRKTTRR